MRRRSLTALVPLALSTAAIGSLAIAPAQAAIDNHISLVSVASPESSGNGSFTQGISDDGRYVVFASGQVNITPSEPGDYGRYVYLRDLVSGTTTRLSHGPDGYLTGQAAISADGSLTVFPSRESSFGPSELRLYQRTTGSTTVISLPGVPGADTDWFQAAISDNGRVVLYVRSTSTDGGNTYVSTLYRYDVRTGKTTKPAVTINGPSDRPGYSTVPTLSADGRYAALVTGASGSYQLVRLDLTAGSRIVIGTSTAPVYAPGDAFAAPSISNTGRFVAYTQLNASGTPRVFLYDATTGTSRLVSHTASGQPSAGNAYQPQVSGNGAYVAYVASSADLVAGVPGVATVYVWKRSGDTTQAIVQNRQGVYATSAGATSSMPYVDGDGSTVAFLSTVQNLTVGTSSRLERTFAWQR